MTILTKAELEAIRKRAEAATPGPWYVDVFGDEVRSNESDLSIAYDITDEANAEFIAHAREDIPKLLAELERLNDLLNSASEITKQFIDEADAEIERLRDGIIDAIFDLEWGCYTDVIYDLKKVIRYDEV